MTYELTRGEAAILTWLDLGLEHDQKTAILRKLHAEECIDAAIPPGEVTDTGRFALANYRGRDVWVHLLVAAVSTLNNLDKFTTVQARHVSVCSTPGCDWRTCERFLIFDANCKDLRDAIAECQEALKRGTP